MPQPPHQSQDARVEAVVGPLLAERRADSRESVQADLWLIDPHSNTVLRAQVVDVSPGGMRLRVPIGYGVHPGQHYELCSHLPQGESPLLGLAYRRRVAVRRAQLAAGCDREHWDVGVAFESPAKRVTVAPAGAGRAS